MHPGREVFEDRVRLFHTDAFGVMYWGSAFDWAQRAVETIFERAGHPIQAALETHVDYPVRHAEIEFLAPLTLGTEVAVDTTIASVGTKSVRIETRISTQGNDALVVRQTLVAFDRRTGKSVEVEPWLRALAVQ